jgi:hypothetical protein
MNELEFHIPYLYNPGLLAGKLPEELFKKIKKEVNAKKAKKQAFTRDLVGSIKGEYVTPKIPELIEYVSFMYERWREVYQTDPHPYKVDPIWTNYMTKGEFNPNHNHPGALAVFVLWIQIPYDLKNEIPDGYNNLQYPPKNSCFEFTYSRLDGHIVTNPIYVDSSYEGSIVMFPSSVTHCVYPFNSSDGERISIAGNINRKMEL